MDIEAHTRNAESFDEDEFGFLEPMVVEPPLQLPEDAWTMAIALHMARQDLWARQDGVGCGYGVIDSIGCGYVIKTEAGALRVGDFTSDGLAAIGGASRAERELTNHLQNTAAVEYAVYLAPTDWRSPESEIVVARFRPNTGLTMTFRVSDLLQDGGCDAKPIKVQGPAEGWFASLLDSEPDSAFEEEIERVHQASLGDEWRQLVDLTTSRIAAVCADDVHAVVVDGVWRGKRGLYELRFGDVPLNDPTRREFSVMAEVLKAAQPQTAMLLINISKLERDAGQTSDGVKVRFDAAILQRNREAKAGMFFVIGYGAQEPLVSMMGSREGGGLWWREVTRNSCGLGWFLDIAVQESTKGGARRETSRGRPSWGMLEQECKTLGMSWREIGR